MWLLHPSSDSYSESLGREKGEGEMVLGCHVEMMPGISGTGLQPSTLSVRLSPMLLDPYKLILLNILLSVNLM